MRQPKHMLKLVSCWLTLSVSQTIASEVISQDGLPPLAKPGEGPILLAEQIFTIEHKPTKECHALTIVETPTGLVAARFAGTREKDPYVDRPDASGLLPKKQSIQQSSPKLRSSRATPLQF